MNNFTKFHCLIKKNDFQDQENIPYNFHLKIVEPNTAYFNYLIERVGGSWGWTSRPKYFLERNELLGRLYDFNSRLILLKIGENVVGYCFAGISEEKTARNYSNIIEIENFGLFAEHTKNGYGGCFLNMIFSLLFETYDFVYLTTRSTNHEKVVPFYQKNNMRVIKTEILPNDLVDVGFDEYALAA